MRAVLQRVSGATVDVDGACVGRIGRGWLILLGVAQGDDEHDATWMADKVLNLRGFEDDAGKMNRSVVDVQGDILVVSQFTLLGDCRGGRRPSFTDAADPATAEKLYLLCVERLAISGLEVATGVFRAKMQVALVNDGPVTFLLDSRKPPST
jgi:D-tyrosyl-tRNA(Tyr) deacylase